MLVRKSSQSNNLLFVAAIVINLLFFGYLVFAAWSLLWPTVMGTVVAKDINQKRELAVAQRSGAGSDHLSYLLQLTYTYEIDANSYANKETVNRFDSKQMCATEVAQYGDKIKVYVNPLDHKISTVTPGNDFTNALIITILLAITTVFLFFVKPDNDSTE